MNPDATVVKDVPVKLYNDVYFKPVHQCDSWHLFPMLLPELRLRIWQLFLQRHRMIKLSICTDDTQNDDPHPLYYTGRNSLGKIVSGRNYSLVIKGRASQSPLLEVNCEARHAALEFYRIRFPFPWHDGKQVLYLNPEYDVLYVRPELPNPSILPPPDLLYKPRAAVVLVDFLHDVEAYDPKNQGVAHLALHNKYQLDFLGDSPNMPPDVLPPSFAPSVLHPTAALSFAGILRRLRSVFCVIGFRGTMRGTSELMVKQYFTQTFPLRRRGSPTGAFDWLESDPRLGVQLDLRQLALVKDPRYLARAWEKLEETFGVERTSTSTDSNDSLSFYLCPTLFWPGQQVSSQEAQRPPEGSREELAEYLRDEAESWDRTRYMFAAFPGGLVIPRHGMGVDAETFEKMERAPSTAVGMWLFQAHAFKEPTNAQRNCFDVSAVQPGLLLFES